MNRTPLPENYLLRMENGGEYIIKKIIAAGGFSLVYEAETLGGTTSVVIKEYYPAEGAFRNTQNKVCPLAGYEDSFFRNLDHFNNEGAIGGRVSKFSFQTVSFLSCGNGYGLMQKESLDMCSIQQLVNQWKYYPPHPISGKQEDISQVFPDYDRVRYSIDIIDSLLVVLGTIHDCGYLHLDITAQNVMWAGKEKTTGRNCAAFLVDYGCAVSTSKGKYFNDHQTSYSPGFAAPELQKGNHFCTTATDIYSVGKLLFFLCVGESALEITHNIQRAISRELGYLRIPAALMKSLQEIIATATSPIIHQRYQTANEMLLAIKELRTFIPLKPRVDPNDTVFVTAHDLLTTISAQEISARLAENDNRLYTPEIQEKQGGNIDLWAEHIECNPGNWGCLLQKGTLNIVGNWSFSCISNDLAQTVSIGDFCEGEFAPSERIDTFNDTGEYIYLLNFSVNIPFRTEKNKRRLLSTLADRVFDLSKERNIKGIWTTILRKDQIQFFEEIGFRFITNNKYGGYVYFLSLIKETAFTREYPEHDSSDLYCNRWLSEIRFFHPTKNDLSMEQLSDIAQLIWETDPYIYPTMFSLAQAKKILPYVFLSDNDNMFSAKNCFIAMFRGRVIGLVLFKKGPLHWNLKNLQDTSSFIGGKLENTCRLVEEDYFNSYDDVSVETISVINVCVLSDYRGMGIGGAMINHFLETHSEKMELYVLQESPIAIQMYLSCGFAFDKLLDGFSANDKKPICIKMVRNASK